MSDSSDRETGRDDEAAKGRPRPATSGTGAQDDRPTFPDRSNEDDPRAWGDDDGHGVADDDRIWREVPPHHGG